MYELVPVGEKTYYIESPAKIGVYLQNDIDVYLIDSGNDKDAGRKVRRLLEEKSEAITTSSSNMAARSSRAE